MCPRGVSKVREKGEGYVYVRERAGGRKEGVVLDVCVGVGRARGGIRMGMMCG